MGIGSRRLRHRRDASTRTLEDIAVSWVEQALRDEGRDVHDCWSPDRDRATMPQRQRRPDLHCVIDGLPTAIEHTRFLTDGRGSAWATQARAGSDMANTVRVLRIADQANPAEFDAFLDQSVARKGQQHVEWGRGILVVTHNLDQPWERLRDAIIRRGGVPWWRVYWIQRSPPAVLVWESGST